MAVVTLIIGESGSGKSTSLRNFEEKECVVFNTANKPLPFKKQLTRIAPKATIPEQYADMKRIMFQMQEKCKVFVIDDAQYLMAFEMFERAKETGYGKFTDCALNFYNLIQFCIKQLADDVTVYFLQHTETGENGKVKAKTSGKMIDSQLTLEGLFSIVLYSVASSDGYKFITQSGGYSTAKSPIDMFENEIDNDLKAVDVAIREYWGLTAQKESEEK